MLNMKKNKMIVKFQVARTFYLVNERIIMETNEKTRNQIDDKYKWDLSSLFKNEEEYKKHMMKCLNLQMKQLNLKVIL